MLTRYIQAAMSHVAFEEMEDGRWFGTIPPCECLWADGDTIEKCRDELESALEDWIIIRFKRDLDLPIIDGIDINQKTVHAEAN